MARDHSLLEASRPAAWPTQPPVRLVPGDVMIGVGQSKKRGLTLYINVQFWLLLDIIIGTHFLPKGCCKLEPRGNLEINKCDRAAVT